MSENLLPCPGALVQCTCCTTVPSGQTLLLPIRLVTQTWLHSGGACLSVTASWLPELDSSSKEMGPGV